MSASSSAKELNVENASRGVWLVKVPKYISSRWERAPPLSEVGRLKITKGPGGKPEILFDLSDDLVAMKDAQNSSGSTSKDQPVIPKAHRFTISDISNQHLALDKAVVNYKPIAAHKADIEFEQRRKAEGKKSREDKDKVMDVLFAAFEKHQYYNIKDLERITKQPIPYLKEILKEICIYNAKNPHKNMWELKPEYRHYTASDKS
ncbi:transcription initiation factor IIF: small subunit-like protein [Dinothrombium tinctorium]|uniref:General transcription factor IIF subunit 2 n=1 Tax=Dinothrombium tinctorium TaxID=1965070 RepID=A0A443QH87_9ACAR|nr:transcription initiation factor IIF: small subunit-like protein [Dinothrombium tinctorium]